MNTEKLTVGQLATNCYLVWDEDSDDAVIIDPGDDGDYLIRKIQDLNLRPKLIIATHGHFDHLLAATELKLAFGIPFWLHQADLFLLKRTTTTARFFTGLPTDPPPLVDKFIKNGDLIKLGREKLKVLETPGHTPGSISLLGEDLVFDGDTLFYQGLGRTDFRYASKEILWDSIVNKLFKLPDKTIVYPGHGPETTIGEEKKNLLKY